MADELVRVEVAPGRFQKMTAEQAKEFKSRKDVGDKTTTPADKTLTSDKAPPSKPAKRTTKGR